MKSLISFFLMMVLACNNAPEEHNAATEKPKTFADSLYKEVIGYHDETMPKMGKLIGYQKALQVKIDSLEKISGAKKDAAVQQLKADYQQIQANLKWPKRK